MPIRSRSLQQKRVGKECVHVGRWSEEDKGQRGRRRVPFCFGREYLLHRSGDPALPGYNAFTHYCRRRGIIELIETATVDEYEDAKALFVALRGMGIHTAIDDFGAGYSVLNSILDIPVDTMKLDRAFIANCTTSEKKVYFLQSLIRMIHGLGYRVVCEGVETRGAGRLPARGRLRRGARLLLRPPAAFGRVRSVGVPGGVGAAGCRGRQKDSQTANRRPARSSVRTAENAEWRRR